MGKLKSRTEWQAFVATAVVEVVVLFAHMFFDVELDETSINMLWMLMGSTGLYGGSRGLAKIGSKTSVPVLNVAQEPRDEPDDPPERG